MEFSIEAPKNSRLWWEEYFSATWDANNGRDQSKYFMQRLTENLPPPEREYLRTRDATVLDWGCAFGDGVQVLASAFPRIRITGLDFAERAIAEAKRVYPRLDFRHNPDGKIHDRYDVMFCSHCLEHFKEPLEILRQHLRRCRGFYLAMTPYKEPLPLNECHEVSLDENDFPEHLDGFKRVALSVMDANPLYWPGQMMLVVYASPSYLRERDEIERQMRERKKWDDYYAALPMVEIDDAMRDFGGDLAERIGELLPRGGKVMAAGCGAGWHSHALVEKGRFQFTVMDTSSEALAYTERLLTEQQLSADFVVGDVFSQGEPEYDLVFNAGVLEHYTYDQQVEFLRGMASRSRKYVLALVPNKMCYWYWLWRAHRSARGGWPFGKETPATDISAAFEGAGLKFLGHWLGGETWSEYFIKDLQGMDDRLRDEIMAVHRSPVVPGRQKAYLMAALGCKEDVTAVPVCWESADGSSDFTLDQLTSSLADSLAATVAAEHRCKNLQESAAEKDKLLTASKNNCMLLKEMIDKRSSEIARLAGQLAQSQAASNELAVLQQTAEFQLFIRLQRLRVKLAPPGSRRALPLKLMRSIYGRTRKPRQAARKIAGSAVRLPKRAIQRLSSIGSAARRSRMPFAASRLKGLEQVPLVDGLVSVVLPVYNHASMLGKAVESVLAQRRKRLELIIVNDGSTDGAEKVLAKYADHPSVRILTQPNQGLPSALSNGFAFARGEFWTWTSADNLMHRDQLRMQVRFLQKHAEAAMVYADYTAIDSRGRPLADPAFRPHNRRFPEDPEIHLPDADSFGQNADNFIGPCFLYRGKQGRLLGEYDPTMGIEDFDYWLRMKLIGKIAHLDSDKSLYRYRVHDASLSGRAKELKIPEHAQKLIRHHRIREKYFAKPWTIHVDQKTFGRINGADISPHALVPWNGGEISVEDGEKAMLLVHADGIPEAVAANRRSGLILAAWFSAEARGLELFRNGAQGAVDLCFADDEKTLKRLALLSSDLFKASPGYEMISLAAKWANSRTFGRLDPSKATKAAALPDVFQSDKRPVRILLQADGFTQGGMEQVVLDLADSLRNDRFDVSLLVLGEQGSDADRMREAGFPVLSLPEKNRELHYRRLLEEREIDLVNAHYSLFGANIADGLGVPFVQTIHNTYVFLPLRQCELYKANDAHTSAYTCVSQLAAHYSEAKLGLPPSKMAVIPNGIDVKRLESATTDVDRRRVREEFGFADDAFVFLNVSSIQPIKCQRLMVRAFAEVVRECPGAKLVLVGRGMIPDYLYEVKQEIASLGLENDVVLAGHRDDALRFYAAADAFLLPSLCEGWSLAMAEALAAGLPVAATAVGSAPDLLPRYDGRLIRTPFGSMTNLDFLNLDEYASREDPKVQRELAAAMAEFYRERRRRVLTDAMKQDLDCREAYKPYGNLFRWLLQGGHPVAARAWTKARFAKSNGTRCNPISLSMREAILEVQSDDGKERETGLKLPCTARGTPSSTALPPRLKQLAVKTFPYDTRRGRLVRKIVNTTRRVRQGFQNNVQGTDLSHVLREAGDCKGVVIHPPMLDWNWMRQRPHQLMSEFAKAGFLSLYCSPRKCADSFNGFVRVADRLYLCESLELVRSIRDPILLLNWVDHREAIKRFNSPLVIYDFLDSLGVSSPNGTPSPRKIEGHDKLLIQSDIVLATARRLYDEVKQRRADAIYCPNGADYAHFHLTEPPAVPADIADLADSGRPIIGYYGALARWFDYELVARAAQARGDYTFLLIGPDLDGTLAASRLARLPNVRWLAEKPYEALPSYLHCFTAAMIPFVINDVTTATSPVKLFEYMAGGKPIVTTDMPECREYDCVLTAGGREEFINRLDEAVRLAGDNAHRHTLDEEALKNTWTTRVGLIIGRINVIRGRDASHAVSAG